MERKYNSINYLNIFKQSWKIMRKNRYLWWFGFFVALANSGGGLRYVFGDSERDRQMEQKFMDFVYQNMSWVLAGVLVFLIISILVFILSAIGRGALIDSIEKQRKGEATDFKSGMKQGRKYFWKIFFVNLALGLFIFSSIVVLGAPVAFLFINKSYIIGSIMGFLAFLIIIPLIILAAYLRTYGYLYTVLGKLNFWPALENAYSLFRKNMFSSVIMGLLFIPLGIIFIVLMAAIAVPIAVIFAIIGLILFLLAGKIGAIIAGLSAILIFSTILIALRSAYEVLAQGAWIFFFHEIAGVEEEAPIIEAEPVQPPVSKAMPAIETREG